VAQRHGLPAAKVAERNVGIPFGEGNAVDGRLVGGIARNISRALSVSDNDKLTGPVY
jgi:hypothetical protein